MNYLYEKREGLLGLVSNLGRGPTRVASTQGLSRIFSEKAEVKPVYIDFFKDFHLEISCRLTMFSIRIKLLQAERQSVSYQLQLFF